MHRAPWFRQLVGLGGRVVKLRSLTLLFGIDVVVVVVVIVVTVQNKNKVSMTLVVGP